MEVWAHRGRTSAKQAGNSRLNLLYASHLGVTGLEADICFTRDRQIIIYHPGSTTPDLSQMLSKDIMNSVPNNIMYLDEFLLLFKDLRDIKCCLDVKQNSIHLVSKAVDAITKHNLQDRIYLT